MQIGTTNRHVNHSQHTVAGIIRVKVPKSKGDARMGYPSPNSPLADRTRGRALKALLAASRVSQARLADASGLDVKTVSAICAGRRDGNVATWAAMRKGLSALLGRAVTLDEMRG